MNQGVRISIKKVNHRTHTYWKALSVTEHMEMGKVLNAAFMALYMHLQTGGLSVLELHKRMLKADLFVGSVKVEGKEDSDDYRLSQTAG